MRYQQYIAKRRIRTRGVCGLQMNIPWGTVCPVENGFILYQGNRLCAVGSAYAKEWFWGYDHKRPKEEIERQQIAEELLSLAPTGDFDTLADPANPWNRYGRLQQAQGAPGVGLWVWSEAVADMTPDMLRNLLRCVRTSSPPSVLGVANG